ncbi:Retrovirus-related Pol polyprotein from transposon 17.6 [Gossypium australe]|uniref:Retrovirus-related Pol polyprotein from transposon 17.6 n=1 Tax=Gossypium australe TaxID=47621 RepID=A0A5B6VM18_9ROSI|nr:Retrovirus-related Pol polyprotein from transposon 17.6 [Gossypium australe]
MHDCYFADMLEKGLDIFMDDFSIYRGSFQECLGLVLGHQISGKGMEVNRVKIEVIKNLPNPTNVWGVRNFLGHVGFYRRFTKDFAHISKPLNQLLQKETPFIFDRNCVKAFKVQFWSRRGIIHLGYSLLKQNTKFGTMQLHYNRKRNACSGVHL